MLDINLKAIICILYLNYILFFVLPWLQMNMIKVSNIMGIDPKPFDPKTFVEEDAFVADESGNNKRIRLENNIVRYRAVRNANGTTSVSH